MTIAVAHVGHDPGVTVADVNLKLIWDVISAIRVGDKGYAFVVDGEGRSDRASRPQPRAARHRFLATAAGQSSSRRQRAREPGASSTACGAPAQPSSQEVSTATRC